MLKVKSFNQIAFLVSYIFIKNDWEITEKWAALTAECKSNYIFTAINNYYT